MAGILPRIAEQKTIKMKKYVISFAFALFAFTAAHAQIEFSKGSFAEIKSKAAEEKKIIFVDAYAVWCGPCRWMEANVFTKDEVGSFYNEHFINYKFDMEKGEGRAFAKKYAVRNYPTYLFLDAEGNVIHRAIGSRSAEEFIKLGKTALEKSRK